MLSERRVTLGNLETITAFARNMSTLLNKAELTELRAFVKEMSVDPRKATIRYNIPMPEDSAPKWRGIGEASSR